VRPRAATSAVESREASGGSRFRRPTPRPRGRWARPDRSDRVRRAVDDHLVVRDDDAAKVGRLCEPLEVSPERGLVLHDEELGDTRDARAARRLRDVPEDEAGEAGRVRHVEDGVVEDERGAVLGFHDHHALATRHAVEGDHLPGRFRLRHAAEGWITREREARGVTFGRYWSARVASKLTIVVVIILLNVAAFAIGRFLRLRKRRVPRSRRK
jgi:hypothetical protein